MENQNILEIYQMIEYLEDFFSSSRRQQLVIGEISGALLFKHVIDATTKFYPFTNILVVEGCQDYIGLMKDPLNNHLFYAEMFVDEVCDSLILYDPFKPSILNPKTEYYKIFRSEQFSKYDIMIIRDAHLIPKGYLEAIYMNFSGKIVSIVDPYDIGGEVYFGIPVLTDTINKLSPINAMARSVYNVDTRCVDRSIKGTVTDVKLSKRTLGKIDDKQYITIDRSVCETIRSKQLQSNFRKNQKVLVTSDRLYTCQDEHKMWRTVTGNSILIIQSSSVHPVMKLRIYSSKTIIGGDLTYSMTAPTYMIQCQPANILMIEESAHHRYNHSVLVYDDDISKRQKYSILKNSNNVTIGHL